MNKHAMAALARPIFDPLTYDVRPLSWREERDWSAVLSVNIGME